VAEYYTNFVTLANRTNINPPDALRDCFISGFRADIRREVKAQCPPSLTRVVSLARLYEDKFSTTWKSTQGPATYCSTQPPPPSLTAKSILASPLPPLLPTPNQQAFHQKGNMTTPFHLLKGPHQ